MERVGTLDVTNAQPVLSDAMDRLPARLYNWKRWLGRYGHLGQCASIEGDYRSPQSKHWHPPGPRPLEPKAADAWDITLAAATIQLRLHLVLKLKYVIELEDKRVAEIFRRELKERIKTEDIQTIEWDAKVALLEALSAPLAIRRVRAVERARNIIAKAEDMMVD